MTGFAQAGPGRSRHRHNHHHHYNKNNVIEGVAIGVGALIIGTAIAQSLNSPRDPVSRAGFKRLLYPHKAISSSKLLLCNTRRALREIRKMWVERTVTY